MNICSGFGQNKNLWALLSKLTNRSSIFQPGDAGHWKSWGLTWQGHVWTESVVQGLPEWTFQDWWNCRNVCITVWHKLSMSLNRLQSKEKTRQRCLRTMNCQSECPVHLSSYIGDFTRVGSIICHLRTEHKLLALRIWFRSKIWHLFNTEPSHLIHFNYPSRLSRQPIQGHNFFINTQHICVCMYVCVCAHPGDL